MKRTLITTVAGVALLGAGFALTATADHHKGERGAHQAERMAKVDTNQDGTLSAAELQAAEQARFADMDGNGDGTVSLDEMIAHREAKAAERKARRQQRMFDRLDTDGDGAISQAEFEARPKRGMSRMDADGDGNITAEEMAAAKAKRGERRGRHGGKKGMRDRQPPTPAE